MDITSADKIWAALMNDTRQGPIQMLNLVRYRDRADYPDGRQMTGKDAYAEYSRLSAPVFARVGGRIVWKGQPEEGIIGPVDEHWDLAFIAEYPSLSAFAEMMSDPEYRRAVRSRGAAVADSRLIKMKPIPTGDPS